MAVSPDLVGLIDAAMLTAPVAVTDALIVMPVVLSLLFGAVLLILRKQVRLQAPVAVAGLALVFAADIALLMDVAARGPRTMMMGSWRAPFGIAFTLDLMGALFLTAAGFAALACGLTASATIDRTERRYGFFPFLFLMMAGVSGAFLTGDIFNLYVWFEVMLIGSFGLLILGSRPVQLDAATKYCFLNLVATTLFLIATGLLYGLFGTLNMADIAMKAAARGPDAALASIAALYLVSFAMKAAAFPLNAWLPASYHTPRIVVSALFAGLLTKVGVYALIRVLMMLFPAEREGLAGVIAIVAGLTMLVGALGALAQSDIRRLLNYVVIAGIGTILAGIALPLAPVADLGPMTASGVGVSTLQMGLAGAIVYALQSILVMTALSLAAGLAIARTGTASLHEMGGLWRSAPGLSGLLLVLLLAVAGLPPLSGFWPKLMLLRATLAAGMPWLAASILVSGFLLTIAALRVFLLCVWRPDPRSAVERDAAVQDRVSPMHGLLTGLPLAGLCAAVVAIGILPEWLAGLCNRAALGILEPAAYLGSVFGSAP